MEDTLMLLLFLPLYWYCHSCQCHCALINFYYYYRKLRTSDAGQMVLNMSVALICHYTTLSLVYLDSYLKHPLCFVIRMLTDYFVLVYGFLIAAEAVNVFVKVVLVFEKINHFPLKASLVAWSMLY